MRIPPKLQAALVTLSATFILSAAALAEDSSGEFAVHTAEQVNSELKVPGKILTKNLSTALDASLKSVQRLELESARSTARFRPQTVVLGLAIQVEAGLGPILKASATPRFRAAFSKNPNPVLP